MTLQDEVANKIFRQVNIKWIIGVWTKKAANSKRGNDKRLQTYKEGCLCSGSYLYSRGLFPPDSCQMASNAPEPQMINKTTMLLLIYSGCPRPAYNLTPYFVVALNECVYTHHELFEQILLVQLVLQNLNESFDPGAWILATLSGTNES